MHARLRGSPSDIMMPLPLPAVDRVRVAHPAVWDSEVCTDPGPWPVFHCALVVDDKTLWKSWEEGVR